MNKNLLLFDIQMPLVVYIFFKYQAWRPGIMPAP
jgi:hypothetical protein